MFARRKLNDLALRKQMLLVEADLSRRLIQTEFEELRSRSMSSIKNPFLIGGASVAAGGMLSLLARKRVRHFLRTVPTAIGIWRSLRPKKSA